MATSSPLTQSSGSISPLTNVTAPGLPVVQVFPITTNPNGNVTGSSLDANKVILGNGSSLIKAGDLSGDCQTSGSNITTVGKVNGVSYPASPPVGTIPVVTAGNLVTYTQTPSFL